MKTTAVSFLDKLQIFRGISKLHQTPSLFSSVPIACYNSPLLKKRNEGFSDSKKHSRIKTAVRKIKPRRAKAAKDGEHFSAEKPTCRNWGYQFYTFTTSHSCQLRIRPGEKTPQNSGLARTQLPTIRNRSTAWIAETNLPYKQSNLSLSQTSRTLKPLIMATISPSQMLSLIHI